MTDDQILEAMRVYGGGFVQDLARLYQRGDAINRAKLKATFADYWRHYEALAERAAQPMPVAAPDPRD